MIKVPINFIFLVLSLNFYQFVNDFVAINVFPYVEIAHLGAKNVTRHSKTGYHASKEVNEGDKVEECSQVLNDQMSGLLFEKFLASAGASPLLLSFGLDQGRHAQLI